MGYSTLYGDTAGGFAVIRDVPKLMVYELARRRNERAGRPLIPESVLTVIAFPYIFGEQLVGSLEAADGRDGIDAAFINPPLTTEQVIVPSLYASGEERIVVEAPSSDGSETFEEGVFGSFGLLLLLLDHVDGATAFGAATDGWGGDWYVAWDEAERTCVRIAMIGDEERDTAEMHSAFEQWVAAQPDASISGGANGAPVQLTACG